MAVAFTVELPAVYVDDIHLDTSTANPIMLNRDPEPEETRVALNSNISLDIVDLSTSGLLLASTQVYVAGVLAFQGGSFQPGFTLGGSTFSQPFSDTFRIIIDPDVNFVSEQVVNVEVAVQTVDGLHAIATIYSFECVDVTAPQVVLDAFGIDLERVRLTFSEPIREISASGVNDALNPANYSLLGLTVPSAEVLVVAVEAVSDTTVDLITNIEVSPGQTYQITVTNVADVSGNIIVAPNNIATFVGFTPDCISSRKFDLYKMFAEQDRRDDTTLDFKNFLACWQEILNLILCDVQDFTDIVDPDIAEEQFVDAMLSDLGNPFLFNLSLIEKRKLVNELVDLYKIKGTVPGIIEAIRFFTGVEATIKAYNIVQGRLDVNRLDVDFILGPETSRQRYTFEVRVTVDLTADQTAIITKIVNIMRCVHEHLAAIRKV